ncbi:MAG TPA: PH domain-containing protein, partial [Acidobacteriota bacterium]|nr:PH domain-containing protein [Acidobacteriota bacterium]
DSDARFARLHPATLWVPILTRVGGYFVALIPLALLVGLRTAVVILGILLGLGAVEVIVRYAGFRFRIGLDGLVIRQGLLWRQERRIPWQRIQKVEISQGPVHRLIGVARVVIRTAGQDEEEAELEVIRRTEAERLQEMAGGGAAVAAGENSAAGQPEHHELFRLPWGDLALGGFTSRLASTALALLGIIAYFAAVSAVGNTIAQEWLPQTLDVFPRPPEEIFDPFAGTPVEPWIRFLFEDTLGKSIVLVLLGLVLAVGRFALKYGGYTLRRNHGTLAWTSGVLRRQTQTLAPNRVQALKIEQSWLRRRFGIVDLWVDSAGEHKLAEDEKKREPFVPVMRWETVKSLLPEVLGSDVTLDPPWHPISPQAVRRRVRVRWFLLPAVMLLLWPAFGWFVLSLIPGFPLIHYWVRWWYRNFGYALEDSYLVTRKGWFHRVILFVPYRNIQNVICSQSPFDRRWKMASVAVDTAGRTNTGGGPTIRYLPETTARRLALELTLRAAGRRPASLPSDPSAVRI